VVDGVVVVADAVVVVAACVTVVTGLLVGCVAGSTLDDDATPLPPWEATNAITPAINTSTAVTLNAIRTLR
jgi:hypothetical protein